MKLVILTAALGLAVTLMAAMLAPDRMRPYLALVGWRLKLLFWLLAIYTASASCLALVDSYLLTWLAYYQNWLLLTEALALASIYVVMGQRRPAH